MADIGDLFTRDPETLTKEDRADIIAKYRDARQQFVLGVTQAGNPKKVKAKTPKLTSLDDLDLDAL